MESTPCPVGKPGDKLWRDWTRTRYGPDELLSLLGYPQGTKLVSMCRLHDGTVTITTEAPGGILDTRKLAEFGIRVLAAFLDTYHDDDEPAADSGKPGYDPRATVAGQFEVAANRDHQTSEPVASDFGFGITRRARG